MKLASGAGMALGAVGGLKLGAGSGVKLGAGGSVKLGTGGGLKLGAAGGLKLGMAGGLKLGVAGGLKLGAAGGLKLGTGGGVKPLGDDEALGAALVAGAAGVSLEGAGLGALADAAPDGAAGGCAPPVGSLELDGATSDDGPSTRCALVAGVAGWLVGALVEAAGCDDAIASGGCDPLLLDAAGGD